jgi:hypothetical protein
MFESTETLQDICENYNLNYETFVDLEANGNSHNVNEIIRTKYIQVKQEIKAYRKYKKLHFYPNPGLVKLSTTHSFKGWDTHTLILILDNENEDQNDFTND